jgi:hypothetical protein
LLFIKTFKDGIKVVSSPIFKALAKKGTGDINDLAAILGGQPVRTLDAQHARGALLVDTTVNPNTFVTIGN